MRFANELRVRRLRRERRQHRRRRDRYSVRQRHIDRNGNWPRQIVGPFRAEQGTSPGLLATGNRSDQSATRVLSRRASRAGCLKRRVGISLRFFVCAAHKRRNHALRGRLVIRSVTRSTPAERSDPALGREPGLLWTWRHRANGEMPDNRQRRHGLPQRRICVRRGRHGRLATNSCQRPGQAAVMRRMLAAASDRVRRSPPPD